MTNPNYTELERVLAEAVVQASKGKGKDRHAVEGLPFEQQKVCQTARLLGCPTTGPIYQAIKKAVESERLSPGRAKDELLGAIVYLAAAVLLVEEQRDPAEDMDRWLAEMADQCRCAPCCQDRPCAGVQQGGVCDLMPCYCERDDFDHELEEEEC